MKPIEQAKRPFKVEQSSDGWFHVVDSAGEDFGYADKKKSNVESTAASLNRMKANTLSFPEERRAIGSNRYGKVIKNENLLTPEEEEIVAKWKEMMDVVDYKVSVDDGKIRITGSNSKGQTITSNINRTKR